MARYRTVYCFYCIFSLILILTLQCHSHNTVRGSGFIANGFLSHFCKRRDIPESNIEEYQWKRDFELNGVPRLYGWMVETFRGIRSPLEKSKISEGVDYFYIDMNALIHCATHGNIFPIVTIEDQQRMRRISAALLNIFKFVNPKKMMYISLDGVCPTAKINQQRGRRFRLVKYTDKMKERLESINVNVSDYVVKKLPIDTYDNVSFNPNYISPGTEFMSMLDYEIRNWIALQTLKGTWNDCFIVYNGTDVPGEGEQKIYETIRDMLKYDRRIASSSHLVYGLDADLIMLSLASKIKHLYVLREERNYSPHIMSKIKPSPFYSKDTGLLHFHTLDFISFKVDQFEVLSINNLRHAMHTKCLKYVTIKYKLKANNFLFEEGSLNRLTDDFILLSFMAGNDFLPHLPTIDLSDNSFTDLINTYYFLLPKFKGYLTHCDKIHMGRLQLLMKAISKNECKYFKQKSINEDVVEYSDPLLYAKHYYSSKFGVDYNDKRAIQKICRKYIEGLFWILTYYHKECPSWNWCYKYHYAPLVSDLANVSTASVTFFKGKPITPLEHLLAITPPGGVHLLPPTYRDLSTKGQLSKYFPEDFEVCEDGKSNEWEHVVKIPFLDTKQLTRAARNVNDELNYNTLSKNRVGTIHVYHTRNVDKPSSHNKCT